MQTQGFAYWFRLIVKILVPVTFFAIASWPGNYWLSGIMIIAVLFSYLLEWKKIGDR
jgi:hypothetical protein